MLLRELDFDFPEELIAQSPVEPRDSCRLMHLTAEGGRSHLVFTQLPDLLRSGDTLVFNDSKVLPARVHACKTTGGSVEILFLRPYEKDCIAGSAGATGAVCAGESWEVLARPSHRLRVGQELILPDGESLTLLELIGEGRWIVASSSGRSPVAMMEAYGRLPLPPYIKTYPESSDSYQTVYARTPGSAAAPTAGLHFTSRLLRQLAGRGIQSVFVTLHVGLDTFQPIRESTVENHRIHREAYSVRPEALRRIRENMELGGRLVAVGTTAARVLETLAGAEKLASTDNEGEICGSTDIFITPGYRFKAVDALLTNFHLPRSSVLALTMAFAGVRRLRDAYRDAIGRQYRFFSFGDAMLIDRLSPGVPDEDGERSYHRQREG